MNKEAFLKEAQDKINALTEKINSLTASLGIQTGDLKEKAQEEINKLLADKSSLTEKFEALKNVSDDKWEEAKKLSMTSLLVISLKESRKELRH